MVIFKHVKLCLSQIFLTDLKMRLKRLQWQMKQSLDWQVKTKIKTSLGTGLYFLNVLILAPLLLKSGL